MADPVEFVQRLDNGNVQRVGNEVRLADADGDSLDLDSLVAPLAALQEALEPSGTLQGQVLMTGGAVQFGTGAIAGGCIVVHANSDNAAPIVIGDATVANTVDGSGNGFVLEAGKYAVVVASNLNQLYAIGTAADWLSYQGGAP